MDQKQDEEGDDKTDLSTDEGTAETVVPRNKPNSGTGEHRVESLNVLGDARSPDASTSGMCIKQFQLGKSEN